MSDFLFHEVSEKEKEKIKKEAKAIMDSFSNKLFKIGKLPEDVGIDTLKGTSREISEREESSGKCPDIDTLKGTSRKIMFENASNKDDDFIIAEKGGWE
jgi:Asp-tRNA(Asn)/Glu-tRNA(Gln) amidotransferase C subunit